MHAVLYLFDIKYTGKGLYQDVLYITSNYGFVDCIAFANLHSSLGIYILLCNHNFHGLS
jgi:hypothetical protein